MTIRRDPNGQPMTIGFNGSEHFYLYNAQGDVVAIANYSGEVVVEYTYDAWGNPLSCTGSLADTLGKKNPFRYRGYVYDEETGLYYLKSRYYDPRVGRFICADSQFDKNAGLLKASLFTYCANNPVGLVDSSGLAIGTIIAIIAIAGGISGFTYAILEPSSYQPEGSFLGNFGKGFVQNTLAGGLGWFIYSNPAGATTLSGALKVAAVTGFSAAISETATTIFTPEFDPIEVLTTAITTAIHTAITAPLASKMTQGLSPIAEVGTQFIISFYDQISTFIDTAVDAVIDASRPPKVKTYQQRTGDYWGLNVRPPRGSRAGYLCRN